MDPITIGLLVGVVAPPLFRGVVAIVAAAKARRGDSMKDILDGEKINEED